MRRQFAGAEVGEAGQLLLGEDIPQAEFDLQPTVPTAVARP